MEPYIHSEWPEEPVMDMTELKQWYTPENRILVFADSNTHKSTAAAFGCTETVSFPRGMTAESRKLERWLVIE